CPSTASLAYVPESLQRLGDTAAGRLDQPLVGLATGEPPTPADLYRCHRRGTRAGEQVADRLTGAAQRLDQSDGFLHGLLPGVERLIPFRFLQHVSDGRIEVEASLAEYDDWYPSIYNLVSLPEATHLSHGNDGPLVGQPSRPERIDELGKVSYSRIASQGSPWFEQPEDSLCKVVSQRGELLTPGRVADVKINGAGSNYSGVAYLNRVMRSLESAGLIYIWTVAVHYGSQVVRNYSRGINNLWKPILIYGKGITRLHESVLDHLGGNREKQHHEWEQPETECEHFLSRLVPLGGVVLDPCCGSGTTLTVAKRLKMTAIGIDCDPTAIALARTRLGKPVKQSAKVAT